MQNLASLVFFLSFFALEDDQPDDDPILDISFCHCFVRLMSEGSCTCLIKSLLFWAGGMMGLDSSEELRDDSGNIFLVYLEILDRFIAV